MNNKELKYTKHTLESLNYCKKKIEKYINGNIIIDMKNMEKYFTYFINGLKAFKSSIKIKYQEK